MLGVQGCWIMYVFPTVPFNGCSPTAACPDVILCPHSLSRLCPRKLF